MFIKCDIRRIRVSHFSIHFWTVSYNSTWIRLRRCLDFFPVCSKCPPQRDLVIHIHYCLASCSQQLYSKFTCQIKQLGCNNKRTFFVVTDNETFSDRDQLAIKRTSLFQIENWRLRGNIDGNAHTTVCVAVVHSTIWFTEMNEITWHSHEIFIIVFL